MAGARRLTNLTTGGPVHVDVEDGRIVRIIPLQLGESDSPAWTIHARGRDFTPPRRNTLSPWTVAHKSTIYSPDRILTPLKRVDFDPAGAPGSTGPGGRNAHKRGESGYEPISWDVALDIVADEIIRLKREVGPAAMMTTPGSHHLWGNVGYRFSAYNRFMNLVGYTYAEHNPDSWEGWQWGGAHMWGNSNRLGVPEQYDLLEDALKHSEMVVFWSADPETTGGVYGSFESTIRRQWLREAGMKMIFVDPYYNHTAGLIGDKWFAPRLGTDVAMALAIAFVWLTEGLYDKEYVAARTHGFDEWKAYVLGESDGTAQDTRMGRGRVRDRCPRDPGAGPRVGRQEDHAGRRWHRRLGRRLPGCHGQRVGARHDRAGRHAGDGQAGQQHVVHHLWSAVRPGLLLPGLRGGGHLRRHGGHSGRRPFGAAHVAQRRHLLQPPSFARGPDRFPAPHPRGHAPRAGWSGGARASAALPSSRSSLSTGIRPRAIPMCRCTTATGGRSSAP